ncbi:MAG: butyrate kinase [bacterium]
MINKKIKNNYLILVINPGSTSTKIAFFENKKVFFKEVIKHDFEKLNSFKKIIDQCDFRYQTILKILKQKNVDLSCINIIMARGGLMNPVKSGVYKINLKMIQDLKNENIWGKEHASNLGALIAYKISKVFKIPCFIANPVCVDEMQEISKISGFAEIERKSLFHALNVKAVIKKVNEKLCVHKKNVNYIVAHLGGGISICASFKDKIIDVNNALLGMGPFSPQRAGSLPIGDLIKLCFSKKYTQKELERKLSQESGLISYLKTDDLIEIQKKIKNGDKKFLLIYKAMIYQIAKEIGSMATVLNGNVKAIILTGSLAFSKKLICDLKKRISFIAPILIYPGEEEMNALAEKALEVLQKKEKIKIYR